jgi:hypothetical protein
MGNVIPFRKKATSSVEKIPKQGKMSDVIDALILINGNTFSALLPFLSKKSAERAQDDINDHLASNMGVKHSFSSIQYDEDRNIYFFNIQVVEI